MNGKLALFGRLATMLTVTVSMTAGVATAAGPNEDFFHSTTGSPVNTPPPTTKAYVPSAPTVQKPLYRYGDKPAQKWFATLDEQVFTHLATPQEKRILSRNFGSPPQLERVIEWTNTAATVAKKFRTLSKNLRSMPLPLTLQGDPEVQTDVNHYRQALAEWYDDSASVLEDYIRPRQPARTQEELDSQLKSVHDRSETVKLTFTHLAEMDSSLRQHYGVPTARYDDALMKYVTRMPDNLKK